MKEMEHKLVVVGKDCVRVLDDRSNRGVEYRGNIPGGLGCCDYAEKIIKAKQARRGSK